MRDDKHSIIGIDIGSISVSVAQISGTYQILSTQYAFHNGSVKETLLDLLNRFDLDEISDFAITSSSPKITHIERAYDSRISVIAAARSIHSQIGSILIVGAEKFGLIDFDADGQYRNFRSNTSCAAGTGSFLDQQSKRLNLEGIEEFSQIAFQNQGEVPKIASRCAVFAKTDLIHTQQEGYPIDAICDGLCRGLAKNIIDTLFTNQKIQTPLIFAGGVSKNQAVVKHISDLLDTEVIVDEYSNVYSAIGAAISLINDTQSTNALTVGSPEELIRPQENTRHYGCKPLTLQLSEYPDFSSHQNYQYQSHRYHLIPPVEVDIYQDISPGSQISAYLGIDIGSTSTKAILMDDQQEVICGFYTRTSGRPFEAIQTIFESIAHFCQNEHVQIKFLAAGTTGSGRKFISKIAGADIALDEITAHARAAYQLDPDVDTIIEIGGQDSKFTTLRQGMVTFSIMNNVCAAGTGSFVEEQAKKLNCPLDQYSQRAEGVAAPISSDKCTVFMERDINYYLAEGYSVNEVLASVLHSVRDNYLTKVAIESSIGEKIFFQGATAKNKALVAAFEQRLNKPIIVSKYCHLTGAFGVALHLSDHSPKQSSFRGIDLYKSSIPVKTETCDLCTNHCKIKIAEVNSEQVAFGFLCGRDYETNRFVDDNASEFDLLKTWKKAFRFKKEKISSDTITIGIPSALHLVEDLRFWEKFFNQLSIQTLNSSQYLEAVKDGKQLTGAEFCAPMAALHGHVKYLSNKVDYIFLPDYFEDKSPKEENRRQYCYYTQYSAALIYSADVIAEQKLLNPVVKSIKGLFYTKVQLYQMLRKIMGTPPSFLKVSLAYDKALIFYNSSINSLKQIYQQEFGKTDDISVMLVGRPYTILSSSMNNGIPEIFARLGIKTFSQEMLTYTKEEVASVNYWQKIIHWKFAARIMETAEKIATTDGIYPVLITSFKCTPDAFLIETFKQHLDHHQKPYLILQLDEHDSSVGYETRIEAGIRAFRNHYISEHKPAIDQGLLYQPEFINKPSGLKDKTLLMPFFDRMPNKLVEAQLRSEGFDARMLDTDYDSIKKSLSLNTGQCLPFSVMAQSCIDYIEKHGLDPGKTAFWTINSSIACNLALFPSYMHRQLATYGRGLEKVAMYVGEMTFFEMSLKTTIGAYYAYMFGGMLKKMGCKVRPYELVSGITDQAIEQSMEIFYETFLTGASKEKALKQVISLFKKIEVKREARPKVAIFGDIYARENEVFNQNLIRVIEENGGEVLTTPYSEYAQLIAPPYIKKWFREGLIADAATAQVMVKTLQIMEKKYLAYFDQILRDEHRKQPVAIENFLHKFNISMMHTGESLETIIKIGSLIEKHPDISLFVQTSPSLCCPSLVTEAMADRIESLTNIPVVSLEYDGTGGSKNEDVIPYLKFPRKTDRVTEIGA